MDILYGLTSCLLIVLSPVDAFQSLGLFCRTITWTFILTRGFELWTDVKWTSGWTQVKLLFHTTQFETVLDLLRSCLS